MTAGFEPPHGDPDTLDAALTALGGILSDLETQSRRLGTGFTDALSTWRAPRADEFGRAATGIRSRTGNARAALTGALDVLGRYAGALRSARHDIAELERQAAHRLAAARDEVAGMDDPESPEAILTEQHAGLFVAHLVDQADGIRSHVRRVAGEAAAVLGQATGSLVPDGADLSPDTIRRQVVAASGAGDAGAALAAGALTRERAWDALRSAEALAPPDGWEAWAREYGLSVPDPLDLARGLDLETQLEAVVAGSMSLRPDQRADLIEGFARRLDGDDLTSLALADPALVGNLDGLPNNVRYLANKISVFHAVASEQARLDAWQPPPTTSDLAHVDYTRLQDRIDTLRAILGDEALTGDDNTTVKQVLAFTPPTYDGFTVTDDGRLALVVGDLDQADHVGVVGPGITNRIDNFGATFGTGPSTISRRSTPCSTSATSATSSPTRGRRTTASGTVSATPGPPSRRHPG